MNTIKAFEENSYNRRHFLGTAAVTIAATQLGMLGGAHSRAEQPAETTALKPGATTSFAALKQIDAGLLNVGYAEAGPSDGPAVILFHGWPYDIHSFVDVAPILAAAGYRVLVPYLRGYGTTRFLSAATPRNAQPAAVAADAISFMDALKIDKAVMGGFDWGGRTANLLAFLWPERVKALVSVSGYVVGSQAAVQMPLPPSGENKWWYLFYFATGRGQSRLRQVHQGLQPVHLAASLTEVDLRR
ncbi:MAG TPA: alpha/beta fold hydrolase [Gemmataceae bacterium]|nr:alpha/beta fold hydrolase [Gemmataceae bacterium]